MDLGEGFGGTGEHISGRSEHEGNEKLFNSVLLQWQLSEHNLHILRDRAAPNAKKPRAVRQASILLGGMTV